MATEKSGIETPFSRPVEFLSIVERWSLRLGGAFRWR
jgi:hypothetical protein